MTSFRADCIKTPFFFSSFFPFFFISFSDDFFPPQNPRPLFPDSLKTRQNAASCLNRVRREEDLAPSSWPLRASQTLKTGRFSPRNAWRSMSRKRAVRAAFRGEVFPTQGVFGAFAGFLWRSFPAQRRHVTPPASPCQDARHRLFPDDQPLSDGSEAGQFQIRHNPRYPKLHNAHPAGQTTARRSGHCQLSGTG